MSLPQAFLEGFDDLSRAFSNVRWAVTGGAALVMMGLDRTTHDVDCIVDQSRAGLLSILQPRDGWTFTQNTREDYVSFFYGDRVLFEFFPSNMDTFTQDLRQKQLSLNETAFTVPLISAHFVFRGKLDAAACRTDKPYDETDLTWLMQHASAEIHAARLRMPYKPGNVLGAVQQYPRLQQEFLRLGIPVDTNARAPGRSLEAQAVRQTTPGRIQSIIGSSVVRDRTGGGPRSAGWSHPYEVLFRQVRLMLALGNRSAASEAQRISNHETFNLALTLAELLYELAGFRVDTPEGREFRRQWMTAYYKPGFVALVDAYEHWRNLPSVRLAPAGQ